LWRVKVNGMKVAFLIHSLEASSSRYRVVQYLPFLKEEGIEVTVHFYKQGWLDRLMFYRALDDYYDVYCILRKLFVPTEFGYIRKKARKVIYDFDDAVMYRSSGSRSPYSFTRRMRFAYLVRRVDHVIVGNNFLKSEALRYSTNVTVIPTSIDFSRYSMREKDSREGCVTIGWLGSGSTLKYLKPLIPSLRKVYKEYPHLQLKIVSDRFPDDLAMPVIKKPWSSDEEISDLKSLDIGIMPLTDDPWSRGKCGLKILQYCSVGIPVVCSPVGINREIVKDGINGFWAHNPREWEEKLLTLVRDERLRRAMGSQGRATVKEGYTLEVNAPRLISVIKTVAKKS
jgi:glycosyltransferase involved in cell wall biosynthesis